MFKNFTMDKIKENILFHSKRIVDENSSVMMINDLVLIHRTGYI